MLFIVSMLFVFSGFFHSYASYLNILRHKYSVEINNHFFFCSYFFFTKKNWMIFFNDYLVTWWPKLLKWAIKNTVESFNFVVLIYLGKGFFFLLFRGVVASWICWFSISEGKLNLLFVFSWICNSVDASDFNFRRKTESFTIRFRQNVNLWLRATHEYHNNWATTNSNDFTISEIRK